MGYKTLTKEKNLQVKVVEHVLSTCEAWMQFLAQINKIQ
jgi:hypothetical protein